MDIIESRNNMVLLLFTMAAILLFGITNVGKTTVGRLLAECLGYQFFDIDEEIKKKYHILLEKFVNTGTIEGRDKKRGAIIGKLLRDDANKVIAITPMSYPQYFNRYLSREGVLAIDLQDTPQNIFDRLVFSDENDIIYTDDEYKNAHKNAYLREIQSDITWYSRLFVQIQNKFEMNGDDPTTVVDRLIKTFNLK